MAAMPSRKNGRKPDELRSASIETGINKHAEGSALVSTGDTRVICTASVEERVPLFLRGKGKGWITAEYGMLPRSTTTRSQREASKGRSSGRTQEIQRLIGRSLRSVVDLERLGERTIWVDCDVIQADGGTRTASITGAYVAMVLALDKLRRHSSISRPPLYDYLAAVSVGIVGIEPMLDLDYGEDSNADVDMNIVMTGKGFFVEVQGTAEKSAFSKKQLDQLLDLAGSGIRSLMRIQKEALESRVENLEGLFQTLLGQNIAPFAGN